MKKFRINDKIDLKDSESTVGQQLHGLLENMPTDDAKSSVRQLKMADELKIENDRGGEWFYYEDADHSQILMVIDKGARNFPPRIIAPIQNAVDAAESFRGTEPAKAKGSDDK